MMVLFKLMFYWLICRSLCEDFVEFWISVCMVMNLGNIERKDKINFFINVKREYNGIVFKGYFVSMVILLF